MLLLLMGLAWKWGGNLQPKADPTSATFAPHPEWYFLGFQQLLRYFGEWFADEHQSIAQPLAAVVIPGLLILVMLLLPFIDRNPERRIGKRPIAISLAGFVVVSMVFLTIRGYASLLHERRELAALAAASAPELDPTPAPAAPADPGAPLVFDEDELALGRRLYQVLECADCHVGPRVGRDLNIPPALEYAGDRFTPRWTIDYLREVPPRRWQRENRRPLERMPDFRFTDAELRAMTGHVMTFAEPEKFERSDFDWSDSTPEKIAQGRELYQLENCASCHKIGEEGVDNGPNLAGAGDRLRAAFMFDIIKSPQRLIPGTAMQDTLMTDEEVEALTYYLMTLK
jgi:mono/diheme cytochrome c family protein